MGLQFENLVISNYKKIIDLLGIRKEEIMFANPFFQRKTKKLHGCQFDYLIQTRDTVFVCEIKFSRFEIEPNIIPEMQQKLDRLKLPKHISKRCVLIHVNGVREDVRDSLFFSKIIDFAELMS